ncbi:NAD-dependent succinate-semialdehyde dehydrogenase [Litorimonas sp. WD9-15]|uniref:NAD-dependent succinate-semialdehyde dehydrogenase n=1 Tax=Litorimonas sp. WD9-15 TaxID=3418716 RepID=UPI003D073A06
MAIASTNPATGEVVKTFDAHTEAEVDLAIAAAVVAHEAVRDWDFDQRAKHMHKLGDLIEAEVDSLAEIMTLEMGKTLAQAKGEVLKCAKCCHFYADHAAEMLADEIVETDAAKSYRAYLPLGVVLAVMPWNYPLWQVIRFIAPALMAGNTGLLKHASNVPQCALALQDLVERAGFPEGSFSALLISGSRVEKILRDDRVRAATLTGSEPAGASVAAICGDEIKPTVLELGGSDAFIIMPSADIDEAVKVGVKARTQNNGQSCIAAKRFIIHADIYDAVKAKFVEAFEALIIGDPTDGDTDIGPLVSREARAELDEQVQTALSEGALRVTGCETMHGEGAYYRPGIIENIAKGTQTFYQEFFGPVAMFFKVEDLDAAIELANDSPFGLGSSIWTQDKAEQSTAIKRLEAGGTFVNAMTASDPRLPFGGIKRSGYGRELSSEGIRAFCNVKTVYIA